MTVQIGNVIQLNPEHRWPCTLWIVYEVLSWGVKAYCTPPGAAGTAYIRLSWSEFERVGPAVWVAEDRQEGGQE